MFLALIIHFLTSNCFVLFAVIFLLRLDSLASKVVFVIKFACSNLGLKTSAAKVLNSLVVIYLSWLWSVSAFYNFGIIPENNQGTNKFLNYNNCFKISEHISIDIQSIIVNHLTI